MSYKYIWNTWPHNAYSPIHCLFAIQLLWGYDGNYGSFTSDSFIIIGGFDKVQKTILGEKIWILSSVFYRPNVFCVKVGATIRPMAGNLLLQKKTKKPSHFEVCNNVLRRRAKPIYRRFL